MKTLRIIFASFMMLFAMTSCGTMKFATMEVQNPIKKEYRNDTETKYRAVGTGESLDMQMSKDIARTNAYSILAEKINTTVDGTATHIDVQNDTYDEGGKVIDVAKTYKRKHVETSYAELRRETKDLQEETLYDKKTKRFFTWMSVEISKKDRKEILREIQ